MGNPEGGSGERKDKEYFLQEIEKLANEAEKNGQQELTVILSALLGSMAMAMRSTYKLAELCADFAEKELEILNHEKEESKKRPKN